jgi:anti-anti-sigma regulatory factor
MSRHLILETIDEAVPQRLSWLGPRPVDERAWQHTLVLTGRLDDRSAHELAEEIDCLCEEGVTHLTLDLQQLDALDADGARVIASGGLVCRHRGSGFAVIAGSFGVRCALAGAGVTDLLESSGGESLAEQWGEALAVDRRAHVATTMVRDL